MVYNPLQKSGLQNTGIGKAGRGVDHIIRKGVPGIMKGDAKEYGEGLGQVTEGLYNYNVSKEAAKIDSGALAEKVGLGRYKPGELGGIDESAWTDNQTSVGLANELQNQRTAARGRPGFDLGASAQINQRPQAEFREGQQGLVSALQQQAAGEGPSLAAMQMDDARQGNIATAMALGASQRGLGAGQGLRQIADQTGMANQSAARAAMQGRIAEQIAARDQLGGVLQGARGQDIGLATNQAGLDQQMAVQQGSIDLQAQGQQDALVQALNQQIGTQQMGDQENLQNLERMKLLRDLELEKIRAGGYAAQQGAISNVIGGLGQGLATGATA